ncbi:MAG: spore cortex biosynthesis protein YabQ [Roseburia sp.]|nr:spore cortex biosynthesis protein YabQ [Roseburia sp.]
MSEDIIKDWYFWFSAAAAGFAMAFVYDLLRLFRRIVRHKRIFVDIEDLAFWTACFFASFTLLYYRNNGVIRFAAVLGAAAGMWLHHMTLGRLLAPAVRLIKRINRGIAGVFLPIHRKYRLTAASFQHKMKARYLSVKRKGEERHGRSSGKKEKKDAGVSPCEK